MFSKVSVMCHQFQLPCAAAGSPTMCDLTLHRGEPLFVGDGYLGRACELGSWQKARQREAQHERQ